MHCRCRSGAPMEYLSHKTSHDGNCSYLTPSHCGTKHLGQLTSGALAPRPEVRSTQTSSAARSMSSNYEGFRYPLAATHERTVPSAAFMVGNLTCGGVTYTAAQLKGAADPCGIGMNATLRNSYAAQLPQQGPSYTLAHQEEARGLGKGQPEFSDVHFNALNHPNFANPSLSLQAPTGFGVTRPRATSHAR
jgi:hypothetical protein